MAFTPLSDGELAHRVEQGTAWLDENVPGWRDHVEINDLALHRSCDCVLGQLFAREGKACGTTGYSYATDELMDGGHAAVKLGFDYESMNNLSYTETLVEWNRLTEMWKRSIKGEPLLPVG